MTHTENPAPFVSIGILAWNEEETIGATLTSIFRQSLFDELARRNLSCEIVCVANGCTDNTAEAARKCFESHSLNPVHRNTFTCRVLDIKERGKTNAWNKFVHADSAPKAMFIILMDADIVIRHRETLWNMVLALRENPHAHVSVDQPLKDIAFKVRKTWRDRVSLVTSRMTQSSDAQLTGQLYCIRADIARNIHLPHGLLVEDGFIKAIVCTDFLRHSVNSARITRAKNASHVFEAYTSPGDILRNQKRQMIGQTLVHLLVDKLLPGLADSEKEAFGATLKQKESRDEAWLKRALAEHLARCRHFWDIFPGAATFRLHRWLKLSPLERLKCLPVALAGQCASLIACWMAYRAMRRGCTDYWPDTKSLKLKEMLPHPVTASPGASLAGVRMQK